MKKTFRMMMAMAIAAFTFTACEDVPEPYNNPYDGRTPAEPSVSIDPAGSGTLDDPYNVAKALQVCAEVGEDGTSSNVYAKGVVTAIKSIDTSYGNAEFTISDDANGSNSLIVYRAYGPGSKKITDENLFTIGDEVVVCGKLVNFKGNTPEFTQGCYIVSVNGSGSGSETPSGDAVGSKDAPKTVGEALTAINAMEDGATSAEFWFVTGKVVKITSSASNFEQYKNLNYLISADGKDANTITVYAGNGLNNTQFSGIDALKAGDEVVVYGQLQKYVNKNTGAMTPEIAKGNYLVKLTPGSGGNENPTPAGEVKKVTVAEFNAAAESTDVWYQLTGTVRNLKDGDPYGNFDLEDATGSVYVYGLLSEKGGAKKLFQDLVAAKGITEGCTLTIIGNRGSYSGKIEVTNAYFVSIEGGGTPSGGGGEETGGNAGVLEGNTLTVNAADLGFESEKAATTATLVDGTTLTFDKAEGSNVPKFYGGNYSSIRLYAKNTMVIAAKKNIVKVVVETTAPSGSTLYNGNDEAYAEGDVKVGIKKDSDTSVSFSGLNAKTVTVKNDYTDTKAGTQLRMAKLIITFAE